MPRVSDINVLTQREHPTLFVRTTTSADQLPTLIGESYEKIEAYLKELDRDPAGVPFVCYHNMDTKQLDVELGFPVEEVLPDKEDIHSGILPAGRIISTFYRGHYGQMKPVYEELTQWMKDHQLEPAGPVYEYYLNGPHFPADELLTQIVFPIR